MSLPLRVVFDCNVFLQALSSPNGPSGRCFKLVTEGKLLLFISPVVLKEFRDVTSRPKVIRKLGLIASRVDEFLETISIVGISLEDVASLFSYKRDPKDAHYVNRALAADARLIVTRDRDLLDIMNGTTADVRELLLNRADFKVLTPDAFLLMLASL